ncbi:hypothetical protein B0H14DRAFT_3684324 [Mycena olivaceomarginata]|nr:hypothetical protein B0H14DRAFT_3684324 [Mycena olivaceomarginata]
MADPAPSTAKTHPSGKERAAAAKKARRSCKRVVEAKASVFGPVPKARHSQSHRESDRHTTTVNAADLGSSSRGSWTGARWTKRARVWRHLFQRLEALLEDDNDLVTWDSRLRSNPKLIVDADGRIVAGDDWDELIVEVVALMEKVRSRGERRGVFKPKERRHRRSNFYTLKAGLEDSQRSHSVTAVLSSRNGSVCPVCEELGYPCTDCGVKRTTPAIAEELLWEREHSISKEVVAEGYGTPPSAGSAWLLKPFRV